MTTTHYEEIVTHYVAQWSNRPAMKKWDKGPSWELPASFCVLEFPPTKSRKMWTYATCGMSQPDDRVPVELHLFSPHQTDLHVELLTAIAHYHRTAEALSVGHTVNLGRSWLPGSGCDYGLISLPYLDGPTVEECRIPSSNHVIRCLWLLPITKAERDYKMRSGLEALEQCFDDAKLDYLDPLRMSVV